MEQRAHQESYLDLTGSDQIVNVMESFLHCRAESHQAVVPQDQHLEDGYETET